MTQEQPIDFKADKPFNYNQIMKITDEFIVMLESLNIAFPVLSEIINLNRDLPERYDLIRDRKPKLFTD